MTYKKQIGGGLRGVLFCAHCFCFFSLEETRNIQDCSWKKIKQKVDREGREERRIYFVWVCALSSSCVWGKGRSGGELLPHLEGLFFIIIDHFFLCTPTQPPPHAIFIMFSPHPQQKNTREIKKLRLLKINRRIPESAGPIEVHRMFARILCAWTWNWPQRPWADRPPFEHLLSNHWA